MKKIPRNLVALSSFGFSMCKEYISNYRKWLRKLCTYSMKYNKSDEDKHDTNYINKHKYTNIDTRKLHLWARTESA